MATTNRLTDEALQLLDLMVGASRDSGQDYVAEQAIALREHIAGPLFERADVMGTSGDTRCPLPQELCGYQPHHPRLGQESRARSVRAQQQACGCPRRPSLCGPHRIPRCTRLLRRPTKPRRRPLRCPPPTGQPTGRHPSRLPQNPDVLRRNNSLVPSPQPSRSLTTNAMGCL